MTAKQLLEEMLLECELHIDIYHELTLNSYSMLSDQRNRRQDIIEELNELNKEGTSEH